MDCALVYIITGLGNSHRLAGFISFLLGEHKSSLIIVVECSADNCMLLILHFIAFRLRSFIFFQY